MDIKILYSHYIRAGGKVCTDTRKVVEGSIFFALKGPNFNANLYAKQALEQGCLFAVVDDESVVEDERYLLVQDGLMALQQLARHHRKQMKCPVIAIGGSNGKTTTKELLHKVLSEKYETVSTKGNLNNHIGVPLTLLSISKQTEIAVIEMGANRIGDMKELCEIALPDSGIITNIGKEHLEGFGSLEGVAQGESELYYFLLKNDGLAFVNADDEWLVRMSSRLKNVFTYGTSSADLLGNAISLNPSIVFEVSYKSESSPMVSSNLSGDYNFSNILAASAIGVYYKVGLPEICKGISEYVPQNNRSQWVYTTRFKIFMDAYNANPSSMEVALRNFASVESDYKLVILGDMFELGKYANEEHKALVDFCSEFAFDKVLFAGTHFAEVAKTGGNIEVFETTEKAGEWLKNNMPKNGTVMLKASRGMQLEKLLPLFD